MLPAINIRATENTGACFSAEACSAVAALPEAVQTGNRIMASIQMEYLFMVLSPFKVNEF
jgi:hypothetical protein